MKKEKKIKENKINTEQHPSSVAKTNDDSIVSKRSSSRKRYFIDEFLGRVVKKPSMRSPLINRGYWIRCVAVRDLLRQFLSDTKHQKKQIISFGAGFDTSYFVLKNEGLMGEGCSFYELDFKSIVERKMICIEDAPKMVELIGDVKKIESTEKESLDIISKDYYLLTADLRDLNNLSHKLKEYGVDFNAPTLFFAECVMTYMKAEDSSELIKWTSENFNLGQFVSYEHINPQSAFGNVMQSNLGSRNSPLIGVYQYPTKESQRQRYLDLGYDECKIQTILEFYEDEISESEKKRISEIEEFDEYEEWNEKCSHYFILVANKKSLHTVRSQIGFKNSSHVEQKEKIERNLVQENQNKHVNKWLKLELDGRASSAKRWGQSSVAYGAKIFTFGGYGGSKRHSRLNDILTLDVISGQWEQPFISGTAPCERLFHTSAVIDNNMYIHGGRKGPSDPLPDLFSLDLFEMKWKKVEEGGDRPPARWRHSMNSWKNFLVIFGGKKGVSDQDSLNDFHLFDTSTLKWKTVTLNSGNISPRHSHTSQVIGDQMFIFGGMSSYCTRFNDLYCLDLNTFDLKKIELKGSIPDPSFSVSSSIYKNKLYLVGGISSNSKNTIYQVDLESFVVENLSPQATTKPEELCILARHNTCVVGNRIYVISGGLLCFSFGTFFNDTFVFQFGENFDAPIQQQSTSNIPKSLGNLGNNTVIQIPRLTNVSFEKFQEIYKERKPVIISGVDFGSCTEKWKDTQYLKDIMGDQKISVHITKSTNLDFLNKNFKFKVLPANAFVDNVFDEKCSSKFYFRSVGENIRKDVSDIYSNFPKMSEDFQVPSIVPMAKDRYFSSCLRFSSKEIRMWTHYDIMDNILCGIVGSKKITLWAPDQISNLYVSDSSSHVLDIDNPDYLKYPKFAKANPRYEGVLNPGEFLFLPSCWFHNVITQEPCISVNIFFKHLGDEFYAPKDLYGNKDLLIFDEQAQKIDEALQILQNTVPDYFTFYGKKLIDKIKSKYNL